MAASGKRRKLDKRATLGFFWLAGARGRAGKGGIAMNMRIVLTGGAITAALVLGACHKTDAAATNEVNAATELSNMADTNANDETMNEDMGNQAATNAE
jgi:hypothetical protein